MTTETRPNKTTRLRFRVVKGSCLDCSGDIAGSLRQIPGVRQVEVLATAGLILIDHDGRLTAEAVRCQAARHGLGVAPAEASRQASEAGRRSWWRQPSTLALLAASLLLALGLLTEKLLGLETAARAVYIGTLLVGGFYPAKSGLEAVRTGRLSIATLLVVAAAGAVALGIYEEAALLVVVFSLGAALEEYVADRARGAIRALMALVPPTAQRRRADGSLETTPVEALVPGDLVVVRPGERIPTDGVVVAGASAVDQSPVTGESMPVEVVASSPVYAGTVNGTGGLEVRVDKEYADTTLARIIHQVEEAEASRGRAQRFADRFGAIYTPAVFALATAIAVLPPLFVGDWRDWIYRALVVLTVSCSCALVLSVPAAVVAAISRAARAGILIKGGAYLDSLASIRVVAFDKTGTLTRGQPRVTDVVPLDGTSPDEALRLAASVEAASEHPLAGAILRAADERSIRWTTGQDLRATPGVGVEATVEGERLFVGRLTGPSGSPGPNGTPPALERLEREGKTVVTVARAGRPLALLAVADEVRDGAAETVAALRRLGIRQILMLTGDNERTAAAIARQVGIDDWHAGLLPEGKTAAIQELRAAYGPIAMVGDGINDAPALATADLGIAMGVAGTAVALETADVALMADDLTKLPVAIRLARRAVTNLRQNIALSLAVIVVLVAAALAGWLSLTTGLLINEASALLIIANGLRLLASPVGDKGR